MFKKTKNMTLRSTKTLKNKKNTKFFLKNKHVKKHKNMF